MLNNKYTKLYHNIINNRIRNPHNKKELYTEIHHIIPKSLGGPDNKSNLIRLNAREHFLCHYLLTKMYTTKSPEWYKMIHAFSMMFTIGENQERYINSRLYASLREHHSTIMSQIQTGSSNSGYGKIWMYHLEREENIKIHKSNMTTMENLGYVKGRVMNFPKKKEQIIKDSKKKIRNKNGKKYVSGEAKQKRELKYANIARETFDSFMKSNCDSVNQFVKQGHYDKSVVNLTGLWLRYIPEYKTTQGVSIKQRMLIENRENFEISTGRLKDVCSSFELPVLY